jgi:hypothetical protein
VPINRFDVELKVLSDLRWGHWSVAGSGHVHHYSTIALKVQPRFCNSPHPRRFADSMIDICTEAGWKHLS